MNRGRRAFLAFASGLLAFPARADKAYELMLVDGRVPGRSNTLRLKKGEKVELRWTSDRPIALHLHGYDIEVRVAPQAPATMSFTANVTGRFPVSEHAQGRSHHHRSILYLEVHP